MGDIKLLDCTLRDGGYYNTWDFDQTLIEHYLKAMAAISADYVELGFRSFYKDSFRGGCAYTTDSFVQTLSIPEGLKLGVMVDASEIVNHSGGVKVAISQLFVPASESPISLVRIPCHVYEFKAALEGCQWLNGLGYTTAINIMQIANRSVTEIEQLAQLASNYPLDVLYFADSMGSMNPEQTADIIRALRKGWQGELGIHTHDNMGRALANSLQAVSDGVTWIDGTVTGMGRGAGNVKTEYLVLELAPWRTNHPCNITSLLQVIRQYFEPMQREHRWGTNTYYYLAGKYGIHPTYIQSMLSDIRFSDEDILAVIEHLKVSGEKKFNLNTLEAARHFYIGDPVGSWSPNSLLAGREVLILGTGFGVEKHQLALENYIRSKHPVVIALNTQTHLTADLIDLRTACHPVRLLADCVEHSRLPQPLITPASMLPDDVRNELGDKMLLDFGLSVQQETFYFADTYCVLPTSMVIAYTLAIATSGQASQILLAGFDGYAGDDPRNYEMDQLFNRFTYLPGVPPLKAITPTRYRIQSTSIYAF